MKLKRYIILLVIAGCAVPATSQLVINELVASNSLLVDDPDFENSSDVVELYNAGGMDIDLSGCERPRVGLGSLGQ